MCARASIALGCDDSSDSHDHGGVLKLKNVRPRAFLRLGNDESRQFPASPDGQKKTIERSERFFVVASQSVRRCVDPCRELRRGQAAAANANTQQEVSPA